MYYSKAGLLWHVEEVSHIMWGADAWNVSSIVRRSVEVVEALHKIIITVVQKRRGGRLEVRRCLVLLVEDTSYFGTSGVCVFIAERWIDSVVDVLRVNERIMYVKIVFGKHNVNIFSTYMLHK